MRCLAITVSGIVQGVFYRTSTKEQADRLGVKGFVRNEPTGDVYIEAEGNSEILEELIKWCSRGPSRAVVNSIETIEKEFVGYTTFEVRR